MPLSIIQAPDGKYLDINHPAGATDEEIFAYGASQYAADPSLGYDKQDDGGRGHWYDGFTSGINTLGDVASLGLEVPKRLVSGAVNMTGLMVEGAGESASSITNRVGLEDLVDSGEENALVSTSRKARGAVSEAMRNPQFDANYIAEVAEGLGSIVPLVALEVASWGAATPWIAAGLTGVGIQAEMQQEFKNSGNEITDNARDLALLGGFGTGLSERFTPKRLAAGLPKGVAGKAFWDSWFPRIKHALISGGVESMQEGLSGMAQEAIAKGLYNPDQEIGQSLLQDVRVGGGVGVIADLLVNSLAGRRANRMTRSAIDAEKNAREKEANRSAEDAKNFEALPEADAMVGHLEEQLGENFPIDTKFVLDGNTVKDANGQQFGPAFETTDQATAFAAALRNKVLDRRLDQTIDLAIDQSPETPLQADAGILRTLGRRLFDPKQNTYTTDQLNYAAGTTLENKYAHERMTAQEALDAKVEPKDMTAAQRINAARIKKGLPETQAFTANEARSVLGSNFNKMSEFAHISLGTDERFRAKRTSKGFVVKSSLGDTIKTRKLSPKEKETDTSRTRKSFSSMKDAKDYAKYLNQKTKTNPQVLRSDLHGDEDITAQDVARLLKRKNISSGIDSPEVKAMANAVTGVSSGVKTSVANLSPATRAALYHKIRTLPRLEKPTQLPSFGPRLYTTAQYQAGVRQSINEAYGSPAGVSRGTIEQTTGKLSDEAYQSLLKDMAQDAQLQARIKEVKAAGKTREQERKAAAELKEREMAAVAKAVNTQMKGFGLERVGVTLMDYMRQWRRSAEGKVELGERIGPITNEGAYSRAMNEIFLALDSLKATPEYQAVAGQSEEVRLAKLEELALETLNHEVLHAMRQADLFTQQEWELLEKQARTQIVRDGDGNPVLNEQGKQQTYTQQAVSTYPRLSPVQQMEEGIAEMIRDGLLGRLKIAGKPRSLMQRVKAFLKGMIGIKEKGYRTFDDLIAGIRSGEVAGRPEGEIRTLKKSELVLGSVPERGVTSEGLRTPPKQGDMAIQPKAAPVQGQSQPDYFDANDQDVSYSKRKDVSFLPSATVKDVIRTTVSSSSENRMEDAKNALEKKIWGPYGSKKSYNDAMAAEEKAYESFLKDPEGLKMMIRGDHSVTESFGGVKAGWKTSVQDEYRNIVTQAVREKLDLRPLRDQEEIARIKKYLRESSDLEVIDVIDEIFDTGTTTDRANRRGMSVVGNDPDVSYSKSKASANIYGENTIGTNEDGDITYAGQRVPDNQHGSPAAKVEYDQKEDVAFVRYEDGSSLTFDSEGYAQDIDGSEFAWRGPNQIKSVTNNPDVSYRSRNPQVDTPAFKKWFGDSKVVDENGDPLVVYHGTQFQEELAVFIPERGQSWGGWNSVGTWFSSELSHAERYAQMPSEGESGQLVKAYVSITDPLEGTWSEITSIMQDVLRGKGTDQYTKGSGVVFRRELQSLGYDGLIIRNFTGDNAPTQDVFVPFESNQIKSATGNRGTFDRNNPDISFKRRVTKGDKVSTPLQEPINEDQRKSLERKRTTAQALIRDRVGETPERPDSRYNAGVRFQREEDTGSIEGNGGIRVLATYEPNSDYKGVLTQAGITQVSVQELEQGQESAEAFADAIEKSKASMGGKSRKGSFGYGAAVYVYPTEDYAGMRLFMDADRKYGFAIKSDGDIVSVFSDGGGKAYPMLALAVERGGNKLDAFDTILPKLYRVAGFRETGRDPWNDEYTPEGWDKGFFKDFNNGEPDVVYMEYDETYDPYAEGDVVFRKRADMKHQVPLMYTMKSRGKVSGKPAVMKAINPLNGEKQSRSLAALSERHNDPLESATAWLRFERDLVGDNHTPRPPYGLIDLINDTKGWAQRHGSMRKEQLDAAAAGFALIDRMDAIYKEGDATTDTTGKLMLWGMLSRMLSTHPHESAFLDAASDPSMKLSEFIDRAVNREWTKNDVKEYLGWAKQVIPKYSPAKSGTSNLNDFGAIFLKKMSVKQPDGRSGLQTLHDLISDRSITSAEVRRKFYTLGTGLGIQNKVLSFVMLMSGRKDVIVLDRIQINSMWDAGRYGQKTIYNDVVPLFDGAHGLARYEAIERSLIQRIHKLYEAVGRPKDASVGRYHWESWVRDSGQVVAHPTIAGMAREAKNNKSLAESYADLGAPEGRYHQYAYGSIYAKDSAGNPYIMYGKSDGTPYKFELKRFKDFLNEVRKPSNGVIPTKFSVKMYREKGYPWFESKDVNREKIDELIDTFSEGVVSPEEVFSWDEESAADSDVSRQGSAQTQQATELNQEAVAAVVAENKSEKDRLPHSIPTYNSKTSPEAQYIARNPEKGRKPNPEDVSYRSREPVLTIPGAQAALDRAVGPAPANRDMFQTFSAAVDQAEVPSKMRYHLTRFKQEAINQYARMEYLKEHTELRENLADSGAYQALTMADKAMALAKSGMTMGYIKYQNGFVKVFDESEGGGKSMIDIMTMLYSKEHDYNYVKLAQGYAINFRSHRLDEAGIKVPVNAADRAKIMAEVDALTDANGRNPVKEWYAEWQKFNENTINFMQDTGVIDPEMAETWRIAADYYPFYKITTTEGRNKRQGERVFGGMTSAVMLKQLKGSDAAINMDMIEAIANNYTAAVQMGMKNVAQQRTARDMLRLGLAEDVGFNHSANAPVIEFRVKGKKKRVAIYDPLVYESLLPLEGVDAVNLVKNTFGAPATWLREMVTRDPGFMMVNLLRDSLSSFVTSGGRLTPILSTLKGLTKGIKRLEKLGVVGGYDNMNDPDDLMKTFGKEMRKRGVDIDGKGTGINLFMKMWDALGTGTTHSDAATRNAVYDDVMARTGNEAEAQYQALEVINFGRRGRSPLARGITSVIPFLNARFQGLDVFMRAYTGNYTSNMSKNRAQVVASALIRTSLLASVTALYYLLVSDDDQYKEAEDYEKDNNWLIPTRWGVPVTLAIPFEVGLLAKVLPETIMAVIAGDKSGAEARETAERGIYSTLEVSFFAIQFIGPMLEASVNYDSFTGKQIVPEYMTKIDAAQQVNDRTTEQAKIIGEALHVSPLKVDHILKGYIGTLGAYAYDLINAGLKSETIKGDSKSILPSRPWYQLPVIKRAFGSKNATGLMQDAYELDRTVEGVVATFNLLRKDGKSEQAADYIRGREHLMAMRGTTSKVKDSLDKFRTIKHQITISDMSAKDKEKALEQINAQINMMLKDVVPALKKMADMPFFESSYYDEE